MKASLLAALDVARSLIETGEPVSLHHPNRWVPHLLAWQQTSPEQVAALYASAGMVPPQPLPEPARAMPHAQAVPQRVMRLLANRPYELDELTVAVGSSHGTVRQSITRLQQRGAAITVRATTTYSLDPCA